jgi:hypothetical protein
MTTVNRASSWCADLVAEQEAEIAALREALDGVRWKSFDGGRCPCCAKCGSPKRDPEVHSPDCRIGKLFAKGE